MANNSAAYNRTVNVTPRDIQNAKSAAEIDTVDLELDEGLAVIIIDRPHACNAIAPDTMEQLEKALDAAEGPHPSNQGCWRTGLHLRRGP